VTPEQIERLKETIRELERESDTQGTQDPESVELAADLSALLAEWEERGREIERLQGVIIDFDGGWSNARRPS
jgi:hypothetical protein